MGYRVTPQGKSALRTRGVPIVDRRGMPLVMGRQTAELPARHKQVNHERAPEAHTQRRRPPRKTGDPGPGRSGEIWGSLGPICLSTSPFARAEISVTGREYRVS